MEIMEIMKEVHAGSNLPEEFENGKPADQNQTTQNAKPQLSPSSFSTYYTWRGMGTVNLNCGHGSIRSNSRVFTSVSEYNTDPALNRFIGAAPMLIYNVAPYNGGVVIKINVAYHVPLNVRVDVLVDP